MNFSTVSRTDALSRPVELAISLTISALVIVLLNFIVLVNVKNKLHYNCFIVKKLSAFFDVVETAKKRSQLSLVDFATANIGIFF